jgi:hypothetical protein
LGGKTATSQQSVSVPPQVLAQYSSVNAQAEQTASNPFQTYSGQFVAPVNAEQTSGIAGTNAAANEAQPYYGAATGVLGASQAATNPVNEAAEYGTAASSSPLTGQQINQYLSPYLGDVLGSTEQIQNQENQQAQAGQLGDAITSGAFGGDRTGIAAANLQQQEDLANANVISGIANTGYQSALSTAQGQQQIGLAGAQQLANIGSTAYGEGANTASELGSLGSGAQSAGLSGAQAQIAAGTVQQQTQQAQDTAEYNQFLQQQSYPFQVDQFLANIAEGTGALSGSTTTTTQPGGFFSDERLKEDMEVIGKTFDGQPIYRYKMKGDPREQIGLSAQKVEKKHPDAVGLAGGYRFVDYGKATEAAANRGRFYSGGVAGPCMHERKAFAYGGAPDGSDGGLGAVLAAQQNMYSHPAAQAQRNIASQGASHQLAVASGTPAPPPSQASGIQQGVGLGKDAYQGYKYFTKPSPGTNTGVAGTPTNTAGAPPPSTTANGVTTNFEAQPPGTTTTFDAGLDTSSPTIAAPATDTSGLGAADATVSAAPAAADVGAGAATDAAATGAAEAGATAAAGAAGEGAADAAAALAAEYAAADVGAAALIAAKRGGAIRRKYDAGGTPYSDPSGGPYGDAGGAVDIPDDPNSAKLQTAGPLVKQPTGLQTAMKMGDPTQASSMAGSIFSNQGLAAGGVAGRRGYDAGGAPDDSDDLPPINTDSSGVAPPSIATDSDRGAGTVGVSNPSWWDKIKGSTLAKPENLVPLLSAIGAMGTAKTVHPGVALAAGLGAGAQSYVDTQQGLAKTAQTQAVTRGQDISNQLNAVKTQAVKDALAGKNPLGASQSGQPPSPVTGVQPSDGATTAAALDQKYRDRFYTQPYLPEETAAITRGNALAATMGDSHWADIAKQQRDQRFANQSAANQSAAQHEADALYEVATMDPDPINRQAAEAQYNAIHPWTGDTYVTDAGGNKTISRTGAPAIGVARQLLAPSGDIVTDAYGRQFQYDKQTNTLKPIGTGGVTKANVGTPPAARKPSISGAPAAAAPSAGFQQPVAGQAQVLQDVENARAVGDQAPGVRNVNQQLLQLSSDTKTGPGSQTVQRLAGAVGLPSGARYQEISAYLDRQAAMSARQMGVPNTNAGLAASQSATGTTEYVPQALQEKVKFADSLNSGAMAYREGLDRVIGTGATPDLSKYQAFRGAWARNFDPDIYRVEDAQRRGDTAELDALRKRLNPQATKVLKQKSANLRMLENGQIPP